MRAIDAPHHERLRERPDDASATYAMRKVPKPTGCKSRDDAHAGERDLAQLDRHLVEAFAVRVQAVLEADGAATEPCPLDYEPSDSTVRELLHVVETLTRRETARQIALQRRRAENE